ncbi:MAG: DUF4040 domain-containing protein [Rickettsiales bacterium]|nr:DUF4040 domain-containing protein [Rickettsiales bacterium]
MIETSLDIIINVVLLSLLLITTLSIVMVKNILTATILLSIFSLLMALLYLTLSAPDVAITEAAVGGGISTILLLAAISLTGKDEKKRRLQMFPLVTVAVTGIILVLTTLGMPQFGSKDAPVQTHVAPYYLNESYEQIAIPNVVTSVLASYRGFDTLGETFVIFTAGMSILLLLWDRKPNRKRASR